MSRIFAIATIGTVLLVGAAALGSAAENSGAEDPLMDDILAIFGTGLELGALVPLVLIVGLFLAILGVYGRL